MPLYEYQCDSCEHRFERIQRFSDPPIAVCPVCGGTVKKLLSSPAIQFKGSGWYITDYAKSAKDSKGKDSKDAKDATDTKDTTAAKESTGTKDAPGAKDTTGSAKDTPSSGAAGKKD